MSKELLIKELIGSGDGYQGRPDAENAVDKVFRALERVVSRGERVRLLNFGTFEVRERAGRKGRNIATGEPIDILPKKVLHFKDNRKA